MPVARSVAQWNPRTRKLVAIYKSIAQASKKTKISSDNIKYAAHSVSKGELRMIDGFVWTFDLSPSFACPSLKEIKQAYAQRRAESRQRSGKTRTGKKLSSETKKRMSKAQKKHFSDSKNRKKHNRKLRGIMRTPETIDKISKSKNYTPEGLETLSRNARTRNYSPVPAFQYKRISKANGQTLEFVKRYASQRQAGTAVGCSGSNIGKAMQGKSHTARGFVWSDHELTDQEIQEKCAELPDDIS